MSRQKQTFNRRLDQDTEPRILDQGKYRAARNARVGTSNRNNVGAVESAPSNALTTYTFPAGTNKCIGTCQDVKNNAIIYCYFNSNGNHRILRLDANTNAITNILPTTWTVSVLGWTSGTRLWNMRIVETGDTQIMFFHAVQGVPMRINLGISALRPSPYTLTIDDITVARKPPTTQPTIAYEVDPTSLSTFIQNNFFQFQYRWIYENLEESTWSTLSNLSIPPVDGVFYNKIVVSFNSGPKGVIKAQIARREGNGSTSAGTINPELYIFNTWEKGLNSDNTIYSVDFFNTEVLKPVSLASSNKLFDSVPLLAGCQELVQSNQIIYGDITEGYDNISAVNVEINQTLEQTSIKEYVSENNAGNYRITLDGSFMPEVGDFIYLELNGKVSSQEITLNTPVAIGDLIVNLIEDQYGFSATNTAGVITTNISYTSTSLLVYSISHNSKTEFLSTLYEKTNASQLISGGYVKIEYNEVSLNGFNKLTLDTFEVYPDVNITSYLFFINVELGLGGSLAGTFNVVLLDVDNNTPIVFRQFSYPSGSPYSIQVSFRVESSSLTGRTLAVAYEKISGDTRPTFDGNTLSVESVKKTYFRQGFKSGSKADFGIVYYDQYLRQSGVQLAGSEYVKYPSQRTYGKYYNTENDSDGYITQMNWSIKHLPPSWAYYYSWVYNGSSVQNYAQFISLVDINLGVNSGSVKIDISNLSLFNFIYKGFSVGDRIRITAYPKRRAGGSLEYYASTLANVPPFYVEGTIVSYSSVEMIVSISPVNNWDFAIDAVLIEAFAESQSEFYFEQNIYPIGNPTLANRFHTGPNQNQNPANPISVPALGEFTGNCYFLLSPQFYNKDKFGQVAVLTESNSISYNIESDFWNKGRPQIETPDQRQQRIPWLYRWGNQLLQDTQVNGMSSFDSGNYGILSARFGALTGMREIGYTLKMIQEQNYNSAFIGRRQIQNADGSTQLVVTDSLIGSVNPSEEMYGTKYPGSIIANGRRLYWLDTIKGCVIREAGNQPFRISDYGMVRYWRDACRQIEVLGYEVLTGWDWQTESLFITRKSDLIASGETINFYDPERESGEAGWVSEHDFKNAGGLFVDMYGFVGKTFTSTLASGVYIHNSVNSYLNLYGQAKTFSITSIFNPELDTEKVFLAHWVKANQSLAKSIFTVPVSAQNPNGMRTYLVPGNYAVREAQYFADLKNDGYTKGSFADDSAIFRQQMISGRPLREQVCFATIEYAGSTIFVLFSHDITYNNSPWS